MMSANCLVLCSCPDRPSADALAEGLVSERLAACVNVLPEVTSVYRWQGKMEKTSECLLLAKTAESRLPALQEWLREHHPYELPEIIAVPIQSGLQEYLAWVTSSVTGS
ncbi:MAG TPA: divalent-cation tolerance protein CutA [Methylococcus sp.]|nr:divalent-cation tolerance protein CutA [Methylococcus sp.]